MIRLGDLLVERGLITEPQVGEILAAQKESGGLKKFGEIVVEKDYVDEETLLKTLADQLKIPYYEAGAHEFELKVARNLQLNVMKRYNAVPISETDDTIEVVFSDPLDFDAQDAIQRMLPGKPISPAITARAEVEKIINRIEILDSLQDTIEDVRREINQSGMGGLDNGTQDSAIMRLFQIILTNSIRKKASDIHIEPTETECHIRARIDGFLQEIFVFDADIYPPLASRIKLTANLDIAERRKPQDGRFSMTVDENEYDFRLSTLPIMGGESIVMRILDKSKVLIELDAIGFSQGNTSKFRKAMQAPYGIIFVTGPTGSGKTTTLYAGLNEIKNEDTKIITVEDPVEYQMNLIQQVQTNEKVGLSFANALRSILRQDPDIVMIGESRDLETLSIAVQAALTGHLVFTTLHTNDAISAVTRIVDMGIEPFLVANAMVAVQAQRLLRRVCPYCKTEAFLPEAMINQIFPLLPQGVKPNFVKGLGCKKCNKTGYLGRTIISEVFEVNDSVASMITNGATKQEILQAAEESGFESMFIDGVRKAAEGVTTIEEVMRVAKL